MTTISGYISNQRVHGCGGVFDATVFYLYIYFRIISGNIVIVAVLNNKSDRFNIDFSNNYDTASPTYSVKIVV